MSAHRPDHARLEKLLKAAGAEQSAAEAHGILFGLLCAGRPQWRDVLLEEMDQADLLAREAADELEQLWRIARSELSEHRMPVQLLLPEDDRPVVERATALRDWAQGFLYGFGLGGKREAAFLEGQGGEALRDFSEIARMDLTEFGEAEEAEEALMQLAEYLWVAASLIWHETHDDAK